MPGFDQTGPRGYGVGTGRGMGPCGRGITYRRTFASGPGRGAGMGFGKGYCWNYIEPIPLDADAEKQLLKAELKRIDIEKGEIERRLNDMQ
jgi:hypothetical protein